jgi:cytochrome c oxidase subunit 2
VRMPVFRGMKRWGKVVPLVLLSSLLFAACGGNSPTILSPAGPVAGQEANLFWFILIVATIVFVFVEGWLIVNVVRFRERPNSPQPRQIHGNNTVELIWTVAPSIVLFLVLAFTIRTMFGLAQPAGNHIEVRAAGHQWWWEFNYIKNGNITTADSLYVPTGTVVQVDLYSANVIHSFWIPQLTGKTDVIPGHNNIMWFQANTPGIYRGECAEYCGTQHAHMDFDVVAVSPADYAIWLSQQQAAAASPTNSLAKQGLALFKGSGTCSGCHGIVGVDLTSYNDPKAASFIGPNLTHFGSRHLIAGGVLSTSNITKYNWSNDPNCQIVNNHVANPNGCGLYQWLSNPQAIKPGNDMNIPSLSDQQITQLIAYLQTLH